MFNQPFSLLWDYISVSSPSLRLLFSFLFVLLKVIQRPLDLNDSRLFRFTYGLFLNLLLGKQDVIYLIFFQVPELIVIRHVFLYMKTFTDSNDVAEYHEVKLKILRYSKSIFGEFKVTEIPTLR